MADMLKRVKAALIASDEAVGGTRHLEYWDDMARVAVEATPLPALRKALEEIRDLKMGPGHDGVVGDYVEDVQRIAEDALSALLKEEGE